MAPRKGAQVATISAQSVRDVLEVRKARNVLLSVLPFPESHRRSV